jgi:hypothetical protein
MSGKIKLHFKLKEEKKELLEVVKEHFLKVMEAKDPDGSYSVAISPNFIYFEIDKNPQNKALADHMRLIGQLVQGGLDA